MNILDAIILLCLIPAVIQGLRKGFISQVISILSIVVGVWAAARFTRIVMGWISQYITASEQIIGIVAFVLILIGVFLILGVVGKVLESILKLTMLGWLNKLLGMVFSTLKVILIIGLIFISFHSIAISSGLVSPGIFHSSTLYGPISDIANSVFPYIKSILTLK
jgi:membrane protein required for colicin V production